MTRHNSSRPPAQPTFGPATALLRELQRLRASEELLRAENEALIETQNQLERTREDQTERYEDAPLALMTLSRQGVIEDANQAAVELFEVERAALVGRLFRSFVHDLDRARLSTFLGQSGVDPEWRCEVRLTLPGKSLVPCELRQRPSGRKSGRTHVSLLDLRERERDAWEKLQLIDAEKRARDASNSKDQLIAMLSHELRTPLTPVLAAASTYSRAKHLEPNVRDVFAMIQRNVAAEARLIDDLLDATGIARGKLRVSKRPVDVHAVVRECVELAWAAADLKGVAVSHVLDAGQHFADGDPLRLRQVFNNLLTNAVKFTPTGGAVQVRSWNSEQSLVVEVQDSGVGFEPADAERLFATFEQLERTPHQGGLGLGLAISKGLVELHGGAIRAQSLGLGQGARFVVELPSLAVASDTAGSNMDPTLPSAASSDVAPRQRLLLVEDHVDTAEMMQELLEERGFSVLLANSLQAALAVDLSQIDAIVSDLGLPDGSGTELLMRLNRDPGVPAIALSGYGMPSDVEASKNAGFDLHFTKPIDFDKLVDALRALLAASGARRRSIGNT